MKPHTILLSIACALVANCAISDQAGRESPENELHAQPAVRITVGLRDADIIGSDNRALQAAVDYVGNLGGGVVEIGPGEYPHARFAAPAQPRDGAGRRRQTVLKKDREYRSPLAADGDFGEAAITVQNPEGFAVGRGVYVASKTERNFLGICATILNARSNYFTLSRSMNADLMMTDEAFAATVFPVISGYDLDHARVENLAVDGNRAEQSRPRSTAAAPPASSSIAAITAAISNCLVRDYNGDGISFQQSNDVDRGRLRRRALCRLRTASRQRLAATVGEELPSDGQRRRRILLLLASARRSG